ncbi:flagellar hook-length control protein [Gordonia sp. NPDC003376]
MSAGSKAVGIKATMAVARDIADAKLDPADLTAEFVADARSLFGAVVGPDDPLWPVQLDVARQVLGLGGVSADELAEWLTVARRRATGDDEITPNAESESCTRP